MSLSNAINNNNKSATICLNMIVKNESKIITRLFDSLFHFIDCYCICDTGSSDNTIEIIEKYFKEKDIPGKVISEPFKNFCHNRTFALKSCNGMSDYVLLIDADMALTIGANFDKSMLKLDYYNVLQGSDKFYFHNVRIVRNNGLYSYEGVTHEILTPPSNAILGSLTKDELFMNDYQDGGAKNDKYERDIRLLTQGLIDEPNNCRYLFYLANSYRDSKQPIEAIKWYKKVLESNNWIQEKYMSCKMIGNLYNDLNDMNNAIRYWIKSSDYDKERIEGIVSAMECLRNKGDHVMVNLLYKKFKNYSKTIAYDKLFVDREKYNDLIEYNNSISAFYVPNEKESGYECCKKIIHNNIIDEHLLKTTLSNVMFYKEYIENDEDKRLYNMLIREEYTAHFSKEECKASKNILFYTGYGYTDRKWNFSYMKNNSLGGSEKAVAYLSKQFPREYNIYVSGVVENEKVDNVTYIHLNELQNLINITPFHTIICSRYIAFLEMFKSIAFYQFYVWAHDIHLLPYGCHLTHTQIIKKWNKTINGCICQTNWHAKEFERIYPELKDKINIINNGINTTLYTSSSSSLNQNISNKIKNKFIYSSCSERGLRIVVELWAKILEILPDASLVISSYNKFPGEKEDDIFIKNIIDNYPDSITHLGQLSFEQLYNEMSTAEYWLYPTSWPETSCITAMEMLANGVICIYYPVAGLVDTMKEYGIPVNNIDEIMDSLINLSNDEERKKELRENGQKYALLSCSWEKRAEKWSNLLLL